MKNEKSSFISHFPYNYTNYLTLKTPNEKLKQKKVSSSKKQLIQPIPKSLFDKINVSIMIPNPETTKIVKNAMISAGANVIVGKSDNADIVISESQIIQEPEINFTPNSRHTPPMATVSAITPRSSKYSSNISGQLILTPSTCNDERTIKRTKSPRNILLNQIPWIYDNDFFISNNQTSKNCNNKKNLNHNNGSRIYSTNIINNSSTSISGPIIEPRTPSSNEDLPQNILIISDIGRRFRPIFTKIEQNIEFHYGKVPQAYHITPFDPIPSMAKELVEKYKIKLQHNKVSINPQPSNNGYCYMCQTTYENAAMHHSSKSHRRNALLENWTDFDQIANVINSEFLNCTKNQ